MVDIRHEVFLVARYNNLNWHVYLSVVINFNLIEDAITGIMWKKTSFGVQCKWEWLGKRTDLK